jgi:hypothetical protein
MVTGSWGSSVGVVIRVWVGRPRMRGSIPGRGNLLFSGPTRSDRSPMQWIAGVRSQGVNSPSM